ncbi:MAG: amino acid carrier protein [Planctomycetota bacterium]
MDTLWEIIGFANDILWHDFVLYALIAVGLLFTIWSRFCQYRALTHGTAVVRGKYDHESDPGAINHFQALSAALSATVGLGNIGGVALAIGLGGPGAVFWMWVVGVLGMAIKMTEVSLSMLYRNTDDPDNPHGGPMWVAKQGFQELGLGGVGKAIGGIFCITLLASTVTGGAMFQAWNTADVTEIYFDVPTIVTGIIMAGIVGVVIIGGIKRIGAAAGRIVPFMCVAYLIAALYVIITRIEDVPGVFRLIFTSAFSPTEAQGAFIGGAFGYAFYAGMKRALFSSEAGQGSSPIAHSAAKTDEPIREGVVAGLEPFIDTIVVCSLTSFVILLSGVWNREPEVKFADTPQVVQVEGGWALAPMTLPEREDEPWAEGDDVFVILEGSADSDDTGNKLLKLEGELHRTEGGLRVDWIPVENEGTPRVHSEGMYATYTGATMTAKAFDAVEDGLGKWLVTLAAWLFALSTMISWSYYGEQGIVYLFGDKAVLPYKAVFCLLVVVSCIGFIETDQQLDTLTTLGTGVMLFANVPIMILFGKKAMSAYHTYMAKLKSGEMKPHSAPPIQDIIEGRD